MNIVNLEVAARQIESLIGSLIGSRLSSIVSDAIDDALGTLQWTSIPAGVDDDDTMAKLLGLASLPPDTELVVVTDVSFQEDCGAFVMSASQLEEFQSWYSDEFSERFLGAAMLSFGLRWTGDCGSCIMRGYTLRRSLVPPDLS
ncbi:hypothetical protein WMF20_37510 [Sorangium sp. So ce834]|uniref:hypothetical protein n=1 Tax=Sorangium sp. So ce834 TaxID=3133321 RepID=UPI003F5D691A